MVAAHLLDFSPSFAGYPWSFCCLLAPYAERQALWANAVNDFKAVQANSAAKVGPLKKCFSRSPMHWTEIREMFMESSANHWSISSDMTLQCERLLHHFGTTVPTEVFWQALENKSGHNGNERISPVSIWRAGEHSNVLSGGSRYHFNQISYAEAADTFPAKAACS